MITMFADIFLGAAALGAMFYCFVLSKRLRKFNDLEKGVGGAVAVLAMQVDDLTSTLKQAQANGKASAEELAALTENAQVVSKHLQLQMASLHDIKPASQQAPEPCEKPAQRDETVFVRHRDVAGSQVTQ